MNNFYIRDYSETKLKEQKEIQIKKNKIFKRSL